MAKHTPGPWIIEGGDVYNSHDGKLTVFKIAEVRIPDWVQATEANLAEADANAELIAAAPVTKKHLDYATSIINQICAITNESHGEVDLNTILRINHLCADFLMLDQDEVANG